MKPIPRTTTSKLLFITDDDINIRDLTTRTFDDDHAPDYSIDGTHWYPDVETLVDDNYGDVRYYDHAEQFNITIWGGTR